jgi:hypothetical protein
MSSIVSMVKYVILGGLFILLVSGVVGMLLLFTDAFPIPTEMKLSIAVGGIAMFLLFVLSFGGVAIMISLHDRHREIAEGVHRIAEALESRDNAHGG